MKEYTRWREISQPALSGWTDLGKDPATVVFLMMILSRIHLLQSDQLSRASVLSRQVALYGLRNNEVSLISTCPVHTQPWVWQQNPASLAPAKWHTYNPKLQNSSQLTKSGHDLTFPREAERPINTGIATGIPTIEWMRRLCSRLWAVR